MDLPEYMNAMVLETVGQTLQYKKILVPQPRETQVLIKVMSCGVCRTDLHIIDAELNQPKLPLVPGHEIIGKVVKLGVQITKHRIGDIVGVGWLGYTCGRCKYCAKAKENLCENAKFTGYTLNGGYAEYTVAGEQFCYSLPKELQDVAKAPLLCAGLIGYRCYSMIPPDIEKLGLYGFGAAAHILIQVAKHQLKQVYAFTRNGDVSTQQFARKMGAIWAGNSDDAAPEKLDAAIIFAPAGELIPQALRNLDKGGTLVCGGIHMSDIPSFPYHILWEERVVRSVANLTFQDASSFLKIAGQLKIKTGTVFYPLIHANLALNDLRAGRIQGAAVLLCS